MAEVENPIWSEGEAARVLRRWPAVSELFKRHRRVALARSAPFEQWELFTFACIARAHHTVQSIFLLEGRGPDAAALTRVLYDHVVTFAWVLIDPTANYRRLLAYEHQERTKLRKELEKHAPIPTTRDQLDLALLSSGWDPTGKVDAAGDTYVKSRQVDEHWNARLPEIGFAFARDYGGTFRSYNAYVHPSVIGVYPFATKDAAPIPEESAKLALVPLNAMMTFVRGLMIATTIIPSLTPLDVASACGLDAEEGTNA